MAVSDSYNFTVTRDDIIKGALRLVGAIGQGETPTVVQVNEAAEALNMLLKALQADGMPLWAITQVNLTPVEGQASYTITQDATTPKILKVTQAYLRNNTSNVDIPMRILTRYEYNMLGNKTTQGQPIQLWHDPQRDSSTVTVFPVPDAGSAANTTIVLVGQKSFMDMDSATDSLDFPQEWYEPVKYLLADRLSAEYGMELKSALRLQAKADKMHQDALSFGTEEGGFYFQADRRNW